MCKAQSTSLLAAEIVAELCRCSMTVATAESCTGGAVSQAITSVPGCSAVMRGAVVAYHNDVKTAVLGVSPAVIEAVGAVSEEVVRQMVEGVSRLMSADCAIATSGIAGPGGGTAEKPVGTVWVAVKVRSVVVAKKLQLSDEGRLQNVANAAYEALAMLRDVLKSGV